MIGRVGTPRPRRVEGREFSSVRVVCRALVCRLLCVFMRTASVPDSRHSPLNTVLVSLKRVPGMFPIADALLGSQLLHPRVGVLRSREGKRS